MTTEKTGMKYKSIVVLLLILIPNLFVYATDDVEDTEKTFSSSDIISMFGKVHTYPRKTGSNLNFNPGSLNTNMQCGQIQVDILNNFNQALSDLKKLPQKLVDQFSSNFSSLASAAPIVALCYSSPTLCAELKNLNLNLQQDISLQTNMCESIDSYITDRADQGRKDAYDKALKSCISQYASSMGVRNATYKCNSDINENDVLVADIVNNKIRNGIKGSQNIIQSALTSTGELATKHDQDRYKLLQASLGEMKLDANGSITPVLGDLKMDPKDMSDNIMNNSAALVCDLTKLQNSIDGKSSLSAANDVDGYLQTILNDTILKNLSQEDVANLQDLDSVDRDVICNSLARSIAFETAKNVSSDSANALDSVSTNLVIPDDVKDKVISHANDYFSKLIKTTNNEDIIPLPVLKKELSKLAYLSRDSKRRLGVALTESQVSDAVENTKNCDSSISCE